MDKRDNFYFNKVLLSFFRILLKLVTGNWEPGTGVWERVYSGNPRENSTWRTKRKKREQFGEM